MGCIPGFGYSHGYDPDVTEQIRQKSVIAFFKRVSEAYEKYENRGSKCSDDEFRRHMKRFSEPIVFQYVAVEKYGYVPRNDKDKLVMRRIAWDGRDRERGIEVQDLENYIENLKKSGQNFQYRRTTSVKANHGKAESDAYTCCKARKGCRAKLRIYKTVNQGVQKNTVVTNGVHNHGLVFSSRRK